MEPCTDSGNATRLVRFALNRLRYYVERDVWLAWDGCRWAHDSDRQIAVLARDAARQLGADCPDARKWARISESSAKIDAAIKLARSLVPVHEHQLDVDPWLFAVANGVIDLRTGQLREARPADLITRASAIEFSAEAECPLFLNFLRRVFGAIDELIAFVQRALGYAMTGITREQAYFVFWGAGQNGKGTLIETVRHVMGEHAHAAAIATFLEKKFDGIPSDVAALAGARFVTASEPPEGARLNEARIKELTGEDPITARFLRCNEFTFQPKLKLFISTNPKPEIRGTDKGIWRRTLLIPFGVEIPSHEVDKDLKLKLRAEAPGILRWLVDGCLAWQRDGLAPPKIVTEATAEYRTEMDPLGEFLDECCVPDENGDGVGPQSRTVVGALLAAYQEWAANAGREPLNANLFGRRLGQKGFKTVPTNGKRYVMGLRLRPVGDRGGQSDAREGSTAPMAGSQDTPF